MMKKKLFKNIRLLISDVDGVLTKGEIIYDDTGRELKVFNVKDGLGVHLLALLGIPTILLSAKNSPVLHKRAKDMSVAEVLGSISCKAQALDAIIDKYQIKSKEICFIGDDLIDVGLMARVGLPVAVNDASKLVKEKARYITQAKGGEGAVREVVDLIIKDRGLEKKLLSLLKIA